MSDLDQDLHRRRHDEIETVNLGMYEAGGEERSGFRVFNAAADHYHRAEVLQRTGAIDITCNLEKVVHGAMSADSDRYASLIVMQWFFQPKGSRRISEATIELLFGSLGDGDVEVEKISFPDTYSLMPTIQESTVIKGTEASIGVGQFVDVSLTGKWEKTVSSTIRDAITLSGGKRLVNNRPPNRIATWALSENQSQREGIPASLKVAILVSREDREKFFCELAFTCKTDIKSTTESIFKKIPKDDPIIFQPNPREKGTRPNKNVTYGDDELDGVDLSQTCGVTFRTLISDGQKVWK